MAPLGLFLNTFTNFNINYKHSRYLIAIKCIDHLWFLFFLYYFWKKIKCYVFQKSPLLHHFASRMLPISSLGYETHEKNCSNIVRCLSWLSDHRPHELTFRNDSFTSDIETWIFWYNIIPITFCISLNSFYKLLATG